MMESVPWVVWAGMAVLAAAVVGMGVWVDLLLGELAAAKEAHHALRVP
jgi:hypothetical protein